MLLGRSGFTYKDPGCLGGALQIGCLALVCWLLVADWYCVDSTKEEGKSIKCKTLNQAYIAHGDESNFWPGLINTLKQIQPSLFAKIS